jgi:hypothetical protein
MLDVTVTSPADRGECPVAAPARAVRRRLLSTRVLEEASLRSRLLVARIWAEEVGVADARIAIDPKENRVIVSDADGLCLRRFPYRGTTRAILRSMFSIGAKAPSGGSP